MAQIRETISMLESFFTKTEELFETLGKKFF